MPAENKAIVRRMYEEMWNKGNLDAAHEAMSSDCISRTPAGEEAPWGPESEKGFVATLRTAFPDLRFTADDVIAAGDKVMILGTSRGTHSAEFFGVQPTGREVTWRGVAVFRLADGKIVEVGGVVSGLQQAISGAH